MPSRAGVVVPLGAGQPWGPTQNPNPERDLEPNPNTPKTQTEPRTTPDLSSNQTQPNPKPNPHQTQPQTKPEPPASSLQWPPKPSSWLRFCGAAGSVGLPVPWGHQFCGAASSVGPPVPWGCQFCGAAGVGLLVPWGRRFYGAASSVGLLVLWGRAPCSVRTEAQRICCPGCVCASPAVQDLVHSIAFGAGGRGCAWEMRRRWLLIKRRRCGDRRTRPCGAPFRSLRDSVALWGAVGLSASVGLGPPERLPGKNELEIQHGETQSWGGRLSSGARRVPWRLH